MFSTRTGTGRCRCVWPGAPAESTPVTECTGDRSGPLLQAAGESGSKFSILFVIVSSLISEFGVKYRVLVLITVSRGQHGLLGRGNPVFRKGLVFYSRGFRKGFVFCIRFYSV